MAVMFAVNRATGSGAYARETRGRLTRGRACAPTRVRAHELVGGLSSGVHSIAFAYAGERSGWPKLASRVRREREGALRALRAAFAGGL